MNEGDQIEWGTSPASVEWIGETVYLSNIQHPTSMEFDLTDDRLSATEEETVELARKVRTAPSGWVPETVDLTGDLPPSMKRRRDEVISVLEPRSPPNPQRCLRRLLKVLTWCIVCVRLLNSSVETVVQAFYVGPNKAGRICKGLHRMTPSTWLPDFLRRYFGSFKLCDHVRVLKGTRPPKGRLLWYDPERWFTPDMPREMVGLFHEKALKFLPPERATCHLCPPSEVSTRRRSPTKKRRKERDHDFSVPSYALICAIM